MQIWKSVQSHTRHTEQRIQHGIGTLSARTDQIKYLYLILTLEIVPGTNRVRQASGFAAIWFNRA